VQYAGGEVNQLEVNQFHIRDKNKFWKANIRESRYFETDLAK
jgi:hypothetical protein